jgi:glutamate synthase (NADPH/NADH) small chain
MGDPRGFLNTPRKITERRPVSVRLKDWREVYQETDPQLVREQAGRCMDCGIPFCHQGCPLGNFIPDWNDLVYRDDWREASERLHATNNFPEFTGRLCPAPCETACVVGLIGEPVAIKFVESSIADRAWQEGWVKPQPAAQLTGKTVAIVGSGPAGLACAQQLARAGHTVAVYERADKPGGLLRYGIPEFKMEKHLLDRRLTQMQEEGVKFRTGIDVGVDISAAELRQRYDALVLAQGATQWRDLPIPGRDATGIYQAMEFLPLSNRFTQGDVKRPEISAKGLDVVILGGGDTGADCLGTVHRQGARSVAQLEILPTPPKARPSNQPWPTYPMVYRTSSAHEEGGDRIFSVGTREFLKDDVGRVRGLVLNEVEFKDGRLQEVPGTERELKADMVLLALGFAGPERSPLIEQLGVQLDERGNVVRAENYQTNLEGVFVCGDAGRGQSLIVWAIAEGRSAAAHVDDFFRGRTELPIPISTRTRPLVV